MRQILYLIYLPTQQSINKSRVSFAQAMSDGNISVMSLVTVALYNNKKCIIFIKRFEKK
jgi:hypothetical protein